MYLRINDMHDTIRNQHISQDDLGPVDHDAAVRNDDLDRAALQGLEGHGGEGGAVPDRAGHDVVAEHGGQVLLGDVGRGVGDGGEGLVVGREDGDVGRRGHGVDEVRGGNGAGEGGEACWLEDLGDGGRVGEDGVDYVDDAGVEGEVLCVVDMLVINKFYPLHPPFRHGCLVLRKKENIQP